ncbi:MAG TPA: carboxypeptidase regulatory-like domain-containing protein [Longimicrobium sp.]|nr:carboxypeptidase regulatory-like domain-containing protein [Longimicrobium sp.]
MNRRILGIALFVVLFAAAPAAAQTVQGTLREPSGAPVERVLVALVDASGTQVARALTGADGSYSLRAPAAGRYRVRAERIGYVAVTSAPFDLEAGETHTERLVASGAAVMLQGITVSSAARRCAVRPGAGVATATLWEEARKALNATAYGQRERLFRYDVNQWTREIDPSSNLVRIENRHSGSGVAELPFRSLDPGELSRSGYVQRLQGDSLVFWGPDAEAMLSPEFLNDHCLRVVEGNDRALIGLAFEPVRGRRVPDIRGTLWLDRRSSELRRVEYGYRGGPPESDDPRVGGTVEYERVAGGPWIVRRWSIRMPQTTLEQRLRNASGDLTRPRIVGRTEMRLAGLMEAGGEVTSVSTRDGRPLLAGGTRPPVLRGTVWDSTRAAPLAGARVYLSGTGAAAESGPDGTFVLAAPGEGRYTVAFSHAALGPLASAARTQTVALKAGDTASVALAVPAWRNAMASLCPDTALRREPGVVLGQVTGPGATQATVTGSWFSKSYNNVAAAFTRSAVATRPDPQGFYVLCGVSTVALVTVRAQTATARGEADARAVGGVPARADVAMRETTIAERMVGVTERSLGSPRAGTAASAPARAIAMRVTVRDGEGDAMAGATVRLGNLPAVLTGADGTARVARLSPDEYRVEVTHPTLGTLTGRVIIPANPVAVELRAASGTGVVATVQREVALAGVEGRAARRSPSLDMHGFYARRDQGIGVFLTDSAIQRRTGGRVTDVLRGVDGVKLVRWYPNPRAVRGAGEEHWRVASARGTSSGPCWMDVYIDGQQAQTSTRLEWARNLDQMQLRDVEAVEVYRSGAEVPHEYRGGTSTCGVVLLWTRR